MGLSIGLGKWRFETMNYGYECKDWTDSEIGVLAARLSKELNLPIGHDHASIFQPYIEIDGLYKGVRIRRITKLSEQQQNDLVSKADAIYADEMKINKKEE